MPHAMELALWEGPERTQLSVIPEHGPPTTVQVEANGPLAGAIQFPAFEATLKRQELLKPAPGRQHLPISKSSRLGLYDSHLPFL